MLLMDETKEKNILKCYEFLQHKKYECANLNSKQMDSFQID